MNNNSKFILSLPGEVAYNYIIKTKGSDISFDLIDDLLQHLYEVNKKNNKEKKLDKANLLLDFYFTYFNTDFIDINNWNHFISTFTIETPRSKDFYNFESPNDNNKNVDPKELMNSCINDSSINKKETKKVSELLLDKENQYIHITTDYFCNTTADILVATINYLFKNKPSTVIKKCQNCGKLFIPKNSTAKYCDRISPQFENRTCKQAMDVIKKEQALNDPTKRLQKNIYDTLYSSYLNKKTKENKKILDNFKKENIVKKAKYKNNDITQEEYIKWLKSFYKTK